jgi:hypothetical protein
MYLAHLLRRRLLPIAFVGMFSFHGVQKTRLAAASDTKSEALTLFRSGAAAYGQARYLDALGQFEDAYKLLPSTGLLFSIAQTEKKVFYTEGREQRILRQAIAHYDQYLKEVPKGERRADAANALADLLPLLKETKDETPTATAPSAPHSTADQATKLVIHVPATGATIQLDDGPPAVAPLLAQVAAGNHTVLIDAPGYSPLKRSFFCEGGRKTILEVPLTPAPARLQFALNRNAEVYVDGVIRGTTSSHGSLQVEPGEHLLALVANGVEPFSKRVWLENGAVERVQVSFRDTPQRWIAYGAFGAGLGSLAMGTVFTVRALAKESSAQDLLGKRATEGLSTDEGRRYANLVGQRDSAVSIAGASFAIAGGLLISGALLYLFDKATPGLFAAEPVPKQPAMRSEVEARLSTHRDIE